MAKRKAKTRAKPKTRSSPSTCSVCGGDCNDKHANLPGYLLIAFGLLALPINFGLLGNLEFAKAWPLILVLFGCVALVKIRLCRIKK